MEWLLLISYDMANDKGRTKLCRELERIGFTRLQYSVFAGTITFAQWKRGRNRLVTLFNRYQEAGDKLYILPQSRKMFAQADQIGTPFDLEWVSGEVETIYY